MNIKTLTSFAIAACLAGVTFAADEEAEEGIKTKLVLGATLTDGNSETVQATGGLLVDGRIPDTAEVHAGAEGNYSENTDDDDNTETTVQNGRIFANVKGDIADGWFGVGDAQLFHDKIADVDYRLTLSPGIGRYLIDNDTVRLSIEAGPAYVWEEVADISDNYWAFRAAERLDWTISDTASFWEQCEYLQGCDDGDRYFLNAEAGIEAAVSTRVNLRLVVSDKYNNLPAAGAERNDVSVVTALTVSLN